MDFIGTGHWVGSPVIPYFYLMAVLTEPGKTAIPVYSLAQNSNINSTMIEVLEAKGDTLRLMPDFV